MSVTSANIHDLAAFVNGTVNRSGRLNTTGQTVANKANVVMPACVGAQYPSTPSIAALNELVAMWNANGAFVQTVHDDLVEANQYDGDGNATVSDAVVAQSLKDAGLEDGPALVDVDAIELYGQPPYSGFVDDPINLANGNLLLRDADVLLYGVASSLSIGRTYNSRDQRPGAFGPGWSSVVDVALAIEARRITFRAADGSGSVFQQREDGTWVGGDRRSHRLEVVADGFHVVEGWQRTWRFDADGTLTGFTAIAADVTVERTPETVRLTDATSGRWVAYHRDVATGLVVEAETSDGRRARHTYDPTGLLVRVERELGDVSYAYDERNLLAEVVDADGITTCRNTYDVDGRVLTQVEAHGRETSYEYRSDGVATVNANDGAPPNVMVHDRRGRMTAMIDGLGNTMRMTYDDHDNVVQLVDRAGAATRFTHDERGNVLVRTDPDGFVEHTEWDDADRLVARTDRAGHTTRLHYEGDGRDAVRVDRPDGSQIRFAYEAATGLPTWVEDDDGVAVRLRWNRDGLLDVATDGFGNEVTFAYDAAGRAVGVDWPEGHANRATLDAAGRLLALRTADGERTFAYTAAGRMVGGRDEAGATWEVALDAAGDPAAVSDEQGLVLAMERDLVGHLTATVDADGGRSQFEYDPVGRQTAVIDPLGHRSEVFYDPEGRHLQVVDPTGRTVSRELDVMGRTTMVVAPGGDTYLCSYHPNGELASATDADGNEWTYEIDVLGRITSTTDPRGGVTSYRYTPGGRLAEVRSPLGRTVQRHYDANGRVNRIVEPDGVEVVYEYRRDGEVDRVLRDGVPTTFERDGAGNVSTIAGPLGSMTQAHEAGQPTAIGVGGSEPARFEFDPRGLLQKVIDPAGVVTEFTHDACGRLLAHTTGDSGATYDWDVAGRTRSVTDPYGLTTSVERDGRGQILRIANPDGTGTARTHGPRGLTDLISDLDGNPLLTIDRGPGGQITGASAGDSRITMARDILGRLVGLTTEVGTVRYRWDADGYLLGIDDEAHQLTYERAADGSTLGFEIDGTHLDLPEDAELERDDARRVAADEHGRRFTYDLAGRLASSTDGDATTAFEYDDLGRLSTEHTDRGVRTYHHGLAGELLSRTDEDGATTTFTYDLLGRRVGEAHPDGSGTTYRWDPFGRLVGTATVAADGTTTADHRIERDPLGRPMRIDGVPVLWDGGVNLGLHGIGDERYVRWAGQVRVATDPGSSWSRRVDGDAWGHDGRAGLRLGYRGELALDDLLLLGDRAYDTRNRTFLSRDPLPSRIGQVGFAATYCYAGNDPINLVDPSGREPLSDEAYNAWKEANTKGFIREGAEAVANDPWKYLAKAAIIVGSVAVMCLIPASAGVMTYVLVGAAVGGVSGGLDAVVEGRSPAEIRNAVIGGTLIGGATGPLAKIINPSTTGPVRDRLLKNLGINAAQNYPEALADETLKSYLPGGDGKIEWGDVAYGGTVATLTGGALDSLKRSTTTGPPTGPPPGPPPGPGGGGPNGGGPGPGPNGGSGTADPTSTPSMTLDQLRSVEGIGDVLSRRVLAVRNAGGGVPLTRDQLLAIDGIGPAKADAILAAGVN